MGVGGGGVEKLKLKLSQLPTKLKLKLKLSLAIKYFWYLDSVGVLGEREGGLQQGKKDSQIF